MKYEETIIGQLTGIISDRGGNPQDSADEILDNYVVIPIADLPTDVVRKDDNAVVVDHRHYYGSAEEIYQNALRCLAVVRFLELEEEAKKEAERKEHDAMLADAFHLWKAGIKEPMAQWEFELLVGGEELEKLFTLVRAARSLPSRD